MADFVRIRNLDDKRDVKVPFNSKTTIIAPGQEGIVEREAACAQFGVWWSVSGGKPIDRKDEVARIKGLYGCFPGAPTDEHSLNWEDVKPRIEIREMDGKVVSTVIDDPEGSAIPLTERHDEDHMRSMLEKMQAEMERMQAQLDHRDVLDTLNEIPPADSPEDAPKRKRTQPEIQAAR